MNDSPHAPAVSGTSQTYNQALEKIEEGKFSEARTLLEGFLQENPVSKYTQAANFNIGYTLEMERRFKEAAERYRDVAVSTAKSAPKLQAYALYRLSYCVEALGDDAQVVAVLSDLSLRKHLLSQEIATSELPARMAAAYSRVGNVDKAHDLYQQAQVSVARFKRTEEKSNRPTWLSRTLYHMGRLNLRELSWENFEVVVRPVSEAQHFLLDAALLGNDQWSQRAADDLASLYDKLWVVIQSPPVRAEESDILKARAHQERQWEMTFQLHDLLQSLKRRKVADLKISEPAQKIFTNVAKVERQINNLLAQQKIGSDLTPAARKRILGQRPLPKLPSKRKNLKTSEPLPPPSVVAPEVSPEGTPSSDPNL